jgi:8-oxo-dGTP diphosphatase
MIENIVRAVVINAQKNEVLLARPVDKDYTFLPGGHIEFGETAMQALDREMVEEIGSEGKFGDHIWTIENTFRDADGKSCHEIALYFGYAFFERFYEREVKSIEDHIEFLWVNIDDLHFFNIKPAILAELLKGLVTGEAQHAFYSHADE